MRVLEVVFWVFAGGVVLWIAGVWISMLLPRRSSSGRPAAASSGGGFAETGVDTMVSQSSDVTCDAGDGGESGGDAGGNC